MRIYSRRGDRGKTRLRPGAKQISKASAVVRAVGSLDEVCSAIGFALAAGGPADTAEALKKVQGLLFELGAELAHPPAGGRAPRVRTAPAGRQVQEIEGMIDSFDAQLEPLRRFILPGGSELASRLHLARAICRRAERDAVALAEEEELPPEALAFMNRISDLLFVLARLANKRLAIPEEEWHGEEK